MLSPHPSSAIEYWFFKVNSGPIALIVDWYERRKLKEHWLRVSVHSPYKREVIFEKLASLMPGDNYMTTVKTAGHAGEVAWDLEIDLGNEIIKPDVFPGGLLKMYDVLLASAPLAKFTGWIRHGSQETTLNHVPGLVSQYWGRLLAPQWWWVSAHQFDQEGVAVEAMVFRIRLWGSKATIPLAYLYLRQNGRRVFILAPFNLAQATGSPEEFRLDFNRIGGESLTLIGKGREYGDFEDGIINTLVGDLEIRQGNRVLARAVGTAGLERRFPAGS